LCNKLGSGYGNFGEHGWWQDEKIAEAVREEDKHTLPSIPIE
jgi:hypothetical protein